MNRNSTFIGRLKERMADAFGFVGEAEKRRKEIQDLDNKVNMGTLSSFSLSSTSNIYGEVITSIEEIESIVKKKLHGYPLDNKGETYRKRVICAKAELETKNCNLSEKQKNYFIILKKSMNDYINDIYNKDIVDYDVLLHYKKVVMLINDYDSLFYGCEKELKNYDSLKLLFEQVQQLKFEIDRKIYNYNTTKNYLKNDDSTARYYNNRKAIESKKRK